MDKKIILVVDDDADLAKMLKIRIEAEGYEFMNAVDGKDMLDVLKIKKPDVILLDIMLPAMDGYSALREMRKNEEYADIPVIILSAKEKKKVGDLFILEKIAFFVEKPFETKELMEKIREAISYGGRGKSNG
ncbi:MAG: response regulator [Candidatus Omnitrophota bacterium]|nr:response regulator [Candidatus Omnitrophota bacterium]